MRQRILSILTLSLSALLFSCRSERPAVEQSVRLQFQVTAPEQVETKAAVNLPAGRTVRIVVYKGVEGENYSNLSRPCVTSATYEVQANGSLTPCLVDEDGNKTDGDAFDLMIPVYDGDTKYFDFYAYSPAIPLNEDQQTVTVPNGVDFMASATYAKGITSALTQTVSMPVMDRLCSAIRFQYIYAEGAGANIALQTGYEYLTNRKLGLSIEHLYPYGTYTLGVEDIEMPDDEGLLATYAFPDGTLVHPATSVANYLTKLEGEVYLLPGAATNSNWPDGFLMKFDMVFEVVSPPASASASLTTYPRTPVAILTKGWRTTMGIKTNIMAPSAFPLGVISSAITTDSENNIVPWKDGGTTVYRED